MYLIFFFFFSENPNNPTIQPPIYFNNTADQNNNTYMDINRAEGENLSDFSVVSVTDSNSLSLSEKWIAHHIELIQKASCEKKAFERLID